MRMGRPYHVRTLSRWPSILLLLPSFVFRINAVFFFRYILSQIVRTDGWLLPLAWMEWWCWKMQASQKVWSLLEHTNAFSCFFLGPVKAFLAHSNAVFDHAWSDVSPKLVRLLLSQSTFLDFHITLQVTVSGDTKCRLWDVTQAQSYLVCIFFSCNVGRKLNIYSCFCTFVLSWWYWQEFRGHKSSIKTVCFRNNDDCLN